jgi:hypothetical protein
MHKLPPQSQLNFERKRYKSPAVLKHFYIDRTFGNINPSGTLPTYAWAVEVTTGYRPTPLEAATLLKYLHPYMQDPDYEVETGARETILRDLTQFMSPALAPVQAGSLMNILAPEDLDKVINQNRHRLQPTAQNILEMSRHAVMRELSYFNDYCEDIPVATLKSRALKMVQAFYPEVSAKHMPRILREFSKSNYPGLTAIETAFISGTLPQHLRIKGSQKAPPSRP